MKTRAYKLGEADGGEQVKDVLAAGGRLTRDGVADWFRAGQMGADEALINAMGAAWVAEFLGVEFGTDGWRQALEDYNAGFAAGALARICG